MATCKIQFRPSTVPNKEGRIFYLIRHKNTCRCINTNMSVLPEEWNPIGPSLKKIPGQHNRKRYLIATERRMKAEQKILFDIIRQLQKNCIDFSASDIVDQFYAYNSPSPRFIAYARNTADQALQAGKTRKYEIYHCAINRFVKFLNKNEIYLNHITPELIQRYESHMHKEGLCPNTTSFYMRNLRSIYNRAVRDFQEEDQHPFRFVFTGVEKTAKRAVKAHIFTKIRQLNLANAPKLDFARDIFMLSFYLRGMAFVDMAYLKKSNITNGRLSYRRKKTKQKINIKWEHYMQEIVQKHQLKDSPYMLPIIKTTQKEERQQYLNASHNINNQLKILGKLVGSPIPLTFYVARHGWASIAQNQQVPLAVISEALGHESEKTTQIYLSQLSTTIVDQANTKVFKAIK